VYITGGSLCCRSKFNALVMPLAGEEYAIGQEHAEVGITLLVFPPGVLQLNLRERPPDIMRRWVSTVDELLFVIV